jgi:pyruvate,water dikinase
MSSHIRSFLEIGLSDVGLVGGKTASLGELCSVLASQGIAVPNGFAITADAYREALARDGVADALHQVLDGLDKSKIKQLASKAAKARSTGIGWSGTASHGSMT